MKKDLLYVPKRQQSLEKYYNAIPLLCRTQYDCDYIDAYNLMSQRHTRPDDISGHTPPIFRPETQRNIGASLINSYETIHSTGQTACCCKDPKLQIQQKHLSATGHLYTTDTSCLKNLPALFIFSNLEPTYVPQDTHQANTNKRQTTFKTIKTIIQRELDVWWERINPPQTDIRPMQAWAKQIHYKSQQQITRLNNTLPQLTKKLPSIKAAKKQRDSIPGLTITMVDKLRRFGFVCSKHWQKITTEVLQDPIVFEPTTRTEEDITELHINAMSEIFGGHPPFEIYPQQPTLASTMKATKGTAREVINNKLRGTYHAAQTLWSILKIVIEDVKKTTPKLWTHINSIYEVTERISEGDTLVDFDGKSYYTGPKHDLMVMNLSAAITTSYTNNKATHVNINFRGRRPTAKWSTKKYVSSSNTQLDLTSIHRLVEHIIRRTYVHLAGYFYRQKQGGPMGGPCTAECCAIHLFMSRKEKLQQLLNDYPETTIITVVDDELVANCDSHIYLQYLNDSMQQAGINMIPQHMGDNDMSYVHLQFYRGPRDKNKLCHRPYSKRMGKYIGAPELPTGHTLRSRKSLVDTLYCQFILAYRASPAYGDFANRVGQFAANPHHKPTYLPATYATLHRKLFNHLESHNRFHIPYPTPRQTTSAFATFIRQKYYSI